MKKTEAKLVELLKQWNYLIELNILFVEIKVESAMMTRDTYVNLLNNLRKNFFAVILLRWLCIKIARTSLEKFPNGYCVHRTTCRACALENQEVLCSPGRRGGGRIGPRLL
jgi:hypothetical protein